ncbi:MAG: hypothetical protein WDN06_11770 [Asticcacaulis sp.]
MDLRDSCISKLNADYVHIDGLLDISGLLPHPEGPQGAGSVGQRLCHVCLRGAHVEDGLEAARAHLSGPPRRPNYVRYSQRANYALDLADAHVNGDVRLFPDFTASGGININGAIVNGSFQAHGAHIHKEEMFAFDATGARIHGTLALDARKVSRDERIAGQ